MTPSLNAALAKFQEQVKPIKKTKTAKVTGYKNGKAYNYSYMYADLADIHGQVHKHLGSNGLSVIQLTSVEGDDIFLTTQLLHDSGEFKMSKTFVCKTSDPIQSRGIALTYNRRYEFSGITGISCEEDVDGDDPQEVARPTAVYRNDMPEVESAELMSQIETDFRNSSSKSELSKLAKERKEDIAKLNPKHRTKLQKLYTELTGKYGKSG